MGVLNATQEVISNAMPGWQHILVGNDDINERSFPISFRAMKRAHTGFIRRYGKDLNTFGRKHPLYGMPRKGCSAIVDFVKYEYLYQHGGVWLDINMQLLRDITPILIKAQ